MCGRILKNGGGFENDAIPSQIRLIGNADSERVLNQLCAISFSGAAGKKINLVVAAI